MYARFIEGGWEPYSLADLVEDNGGPASFSAPQPFDYAAAANHDMVRIENGDRPDDTLTRTAVSTGIADVGGVPVRQWALEPLPLDDAKAMVWTEAKAARDQHENGGVTIAGVGTFQSDAISREYINGAVLMAQIAIAQSQPYSINWTLADNSVVTLDAAAMIGVGVAAGQHVAACHAVAQGLRAAIETADNVDALDLIDLEAGWP